MTYQLLAMMQNKWNSHILVVEIQNDIAALENSLAVPQNVKHRVTM